jgi:hypothetical protein
VSWFFAAFLAAFVQSLKLINYGWMAEGNSYVLQFAFASSNLALLLSLENSEDG